MRSGSICRDDFLDDSKLSYVLPRDRAKDMASD